LPAPKFIVTSTDITRGKPDPEPYLKGAAALSLSPTDCIVIEDAPAGIRAGKAAKAHVVALQTTERDQLLLEAGADYIVKDCAAFEFASRADGEKLEFGLRDALAAFR
jgi:sugar-phosphatase